VEFIEAQNKLEAVARISQLTNSGPETLGPGSKERKSVVLNLAKNLGLRTESTSTKHQIASEIAKELGFEWVKEYESSGQTLTLKGLNSLLRAGSDHFFRDNPELEGLHENGFEQELENISKVIATKTPKHMDGFTAINQMKSSEFNQWRATEWQGFYFEFLIAPELINVLGGGPKKIGSTTFDYALRYTWDFKVHSALTKNGTKSNSQCQLNDAKSMDQAVLQGGIGLIILTGAPTYDLNFTRWHKKFRSGSEEEPKKLLKKEFQTERIDFFFIPSKERLEQALQRGEIVFFRQGHQPNGMPRKVKYSLNLKKAMSGDLFLNSIQF